MEGGTGISHNSSLLLTPHSSLHSSQGGRRTSCPNKCSEAGLTVWADKTGDYLVFPGCLSRLSQLSRLSLLAPPGRRRERRGERSPLSCPAGRTQSEWSPVLTSGQLWSLYLTSPHLPSSAVSTLSSVLSSHLLLFKQTASPTNKVQHGFC